MVCFVFVVTVVAQVHESMSATMFQHLVDMALRIGSSYSSKMASGAHRNKLAGQGREVKVIAKATRKRRTPTVSRPEEDNDGETDGEEQAEESKAQAAPVLLSEFLHLTTA